MNVVLAKTMNDSKLYYTPPSDECFEDLKKSAISLWSTMGDEPSYSKEKIGRIKDIANIKDNFMYMFAMFDINNQRKVGASIRDETREAINERLVSGGSPEYLLL